MKPEADVITKGMMRQEKRIEQGQRTGKFQAGEMGMGTEEEITVGRQEYWQRHRKKWW